MNKSRKGKLFLKEFSYVKVGKSKTRQAQMFKRQV